ncbi:MAG: acetylglutamate kinase [Candidatus Kapaibacterium sp.]|nr:MAG: acetylglutamate kinase [Candidatus Kapabacteria bacterium]
MKTLSIIKIGGNVIDSPDALTRFLGDLSTLDRSEHAWILVHGGGKIATDMAKRLGIEAQMLEGRRITDEAMLEIVTMVYGGLVNKRIVAGLQAKGVNALGLTGADGDIITAEKRRHPSIDYGFVGDIERVNTAQIRAFLDSGCTPVLAPLTHDGAGLLLNTNADTIASRVASALASEAEMQAFYGVRLYYAFEKRGVLRDVADATSVFPELSAAEIEDVRASGAIAAGMLPKIDNALAALRAGVEQVEICHSDEILFALQGKHSGTRIVL